MSSPYVVRALAALLIGRAGGHAKPAVAGAVDKDLGRDAKAVLGRVAIGDGVGDETVTRLHIDDACVQHQRQVGLGPA